VTWAESDKPIYVGLFYNKNIPTFDDRVKEIKNKLKANK